MSVKDKKVQKAYYESHPYDELELGLRRSFIPRNDVHEIEHGSSKTYEVWNMISLTRENHDLAQGYKISKKRQFVAKLLAGSCLPGEMPDDIVRKYDLGIIVRNFDKFKRRYIMICYGG